MELMDDEDGNLRSWARTSADMVAGKSYSKPSARPPRRQIMLEDDIDAL